MPRAKLLKHYNVDRVNNTNYALSEAERAQLLEELKQIDGNIDYPINELSNIIEDYRRLDILLQSIPTEGDYTKTKDTISISIQTIQNLITHPDMAEPIDMELNKRMDLSVMKVMQFLNGLDRCVALSEPEPFFHPFIDTQKENKIYAIHSISMKLPISIPK
jgi:hypothetical protein